MMVKKKKIKKRNLKSQLKMPQKPNKVTNIKAQHRELHLANPLNTTTKAHLDKKKYSRKKKHKKNISHDKD